SLPTPRLTALLADGAPVLLLTCDRALAQHPELADRLPTQRVTANGLPVAASPESRVDQRQPAAPAPREARSSEAPGRPENSEHPENPGPPTYPGTPEAAEAAE